MPYPAISSRRMPYDVDGTEVGYTFGVSRSIPVTFGQGVQRWLTSAEKRDLNKEDRSSTFGGTSGGPALSLIWFFPESREVTHIGVLYALGVSHAHITAIEGSSNTTNGMDGDWESAVYTYPELSYEIDRWRAKIFVVSFSGPKKVLRFAWGVTGANHTINISAAHLYGYKAAGETPDDLLFCDASTGAEKTALMDWGDQPEGTTLIDSFKVKNASASKIANDINLQLNHADFLMSWSADGPWTATLDIATLGIGALSNTIYIRNKLEPPLLLLGPYAARVIASVDSWT